MAAVAAAAHELVQILSTVGTLDAATAQSAATAVSDLLDAFVMTDMSSQGSASSSTDAASSLAAAVDQLARAAVPTFLNMTCCHDGTAASANVTVTSANLNMTISLKAASEIAAELVGCDSGIADRPITAQMPSDVLRSVQGVDPTLPIAAVLFTVGVNLRASLEPPVTARSDSSPRRLIARSHSSTIEPSTSPIVSFSLRQGGEILQVRNTLAPINISLPFRSASFTIRVNECVQGVCTESFRSESPPCIGAPDALEDLASCDTAVECRFWNETEQRWSTTGCATTLGTDGSVGCSCSHLTEFIAFEWPTGRAARLLPAARRNKLSERAFSCTFQPSRSWRSVPKIWGCTLFLLVLFAVLLGNAVIRDRIEIRKMLRLIARKRVDDDNQRQRKDEHRRAAEEQRRAAEKQRRVSEMERRAAENESRVRTEREALQRTIAEEQQRAAELRGELQSAEGALAASRRSTLRMFEDGSTLISLSQTRKVSSIPSDVKVESERPSPPASPPASESLDSSDVSQAPSATPTLPLMVADVPTTEAADDKDTPYSAAEGDLLPASPAEAEAAAAAEVADAAARAAAVAAKAAAEAAAEAAAQAAEAAAEEAEAVAEEADAAAAAEAAAKGADIPPFREQLARVVPAVEWMECASADGANTMESFVSDIVSGLFERATAAATAATAASIVSGLFERAIVAAAAADAAAVEAAKAAAAEVVAAEAAAAEAAAAEAAAAEAANVAAEAAKAAARDRVGRARARRSRVEARARETEEAAREAAATAENAARIAESAAAGRLQLGASMKANVIGAKLKAKADDKAKVAAEKAARIATSAAVGRLQLGASLKVKSIGTKLKSKADEAIHRKKTLSYRTRVVVNAAAKRMHDCWSSLRVVTRGVTARCARQNIDSAWQRHRLTCIRNHTLITGIIHRGTAGYTRAQTVMILLNSFSFELIMLCLFYSPPDPRADGEPTTTVNAVRACAT